MADSESAGARETEAILKNWQWTSIIFALNHGCVTTPLIFASTLLAAKVGYAGAALLYICTCLCALFISVPTVAALGQRGGLLLGMALYSVYVGSFALSAAAPVGSWPQWAAFLPGSCLGGAAASILWTAQGGYLGSSVGLLMEAGEVDRQSATASHAASFAVYYLLFEVSCKLLSSIALHLHWPPWAIFTACLGLAVASTCAVVVLWDLGAAPRASTGAKVASKLLMSTALWPDPILWCLSLTNLTFGFAAAFINGYVNAEYTKPQLGPDFVGFFATATALVAAIVSHGLGAAAKRFGTKGPLILFGSLCLMAIPALVLLVGFDGWRYWLIVPYVLQGCGRAVYESTNKGIFADFFPGEKSEGAFANSMMQACLSFALSFLFSALMSRAALAAIVLTLAACTFPAYLQARKFRDQETGTASDSESSSQH